MIKCENCGSNKPKDIEICLTCGADFQWKSVLTKDQLHLNLDFDQPENLANQIRDHFFKAYETVRSFSAKEKALMPHFNLAAGLAVIEMLYTDGFSKDNPEVWEWMDFAVSWLRDHLKN